MKGLLKEIMQEQAQSSLVAVVNCWTVGVHKLEDARSNLVCGSYVMGYSRGSSRSKTDEKKAQN